MDLSVQIGQKQNKMRFLVTDLGHEDLILGYPWLATFEPKFGWADGTIDTEYLPVIVKSLNWETQLTKTAILQATVEPKSDQEKTQIVEELEEECFTISTRLAQEAHQYQQEVKIPEIYQRHSKVFSEEESHRFPPSRPWDHAIELKEGGPEAINCKIIPTTKEEDEALKKFITEQMEKGIHSKIEISICISVLLYQKEGQKVMPYTRLPEAKPAHNSKQIPLTPYTRLNLTSQRRQHLFEIRHTLGI